MNISPVPKKYLEIASQYQIPEKYAVLIYNRQKQKKGVDDIILRFHLESGLSEADARKKVGSLKHDYKVTLAALNLVEPEFDFLEEARENLNLSIGKVSKVINTKLPYLQSRVVDVISDLHIPFLNEKALATVLANPGDVLYILGDILDMYASARYPRTIDYITTRQELAQGRAFLEKVAQIYPEIYIITGNHDERSQKQITEFLPHLLPLFQNPIELISMGLDNIFILSSDFKDTAPSVEYGTNFKLPSLAQKDDVILAHLESFCGKDAAEQCHKWLGDFKHVLDLKPYKVLLQAHTHRINSMYTPTGTLLIQTGSLCKTMPYVIQHQGKYQPPTNGYVKLSQIRTKEGWQTQTEKTQLIHIS